VGCGGEIGEIEREPAGDEMMRRGRCRHITGDDLQGGYSRMALGCKGWIEKVLSNRRGNRLCRINLVHQIGSVD